MPPLVMALAVFIAFMTLVAFMGAMSSRRNGERHCLTSWTDGCIRKSTFQTNWNLLQAFRHHALNARDTMTSTTPENTCTPKLQYPRTKFTRTLQAGTNRQPCSEPPLPTMVAKKANFKMETCSQTVSSKQPSSHAPQQDPHHLLKDLNGRIHPPLFASVSLVQLRKPQMVAYNTRSSSVCWALFAKPHRSAPQKTA